MKEKYTQTIFSTWALYSEWVS